MHFRDLLDKELNTLKKEFHLDPLEQRTWDCDPLTVVSDVDQKIVYTGKVQVEVTPRADGTTDLLADVSVEGWRPNLRTAKVQGFSASDGYFGGSRDGAYCHGYDTDGKPTTWYINGASDAHSEWMMDNETYKSPTRETPERK